MISELDRYSSDLLIELACNSFENQRKLSEKTGHSLGTVNRGLKELQLNGYITEKFSLTQKGALYLEERRPKQAVILAAGFGMRMVPINTETPKALVEVNGEPLIERLIKQLHEVGVKRIAIVVGFMKERFDYLIDDYGVELIVNREYSTKNNLHSLALASDYLGNGYIVPCDLYCKKNPFCTSESYSWYLVGDQQTTESTLRVNRKTELIPVSMQDAGNAMIGISYLTTSFAKEFLEHLCYMDKDPTYDTVFWEEVLLNNHREPLYAKLTSLQLVTEINTYEQLRELDQNSGQLQSDAIQIIADALHADEKEITNITVLKKGMTNRSFLFTCRDTQYIMRIPGEGTDQLINRAEEADVYHAIDGLHLSDDLIYINPENGYKITRFLDEARVCNPENWSDVKACMKKARAFHELRLKVSHTFDIFEKINFYESLWNGISSEYRDYRKTKENVFSLKKIIDEQVDPVKDYVLTHIDAVADNFLFIPGKDEKEEIRLIDWEYSAMQDSDVDIAMFAIYSLYRRDQVDQLIDLYYPEGCSKERRKKIYCYIAACGLLWSNWCEYKRNLGVEFGEYSIRQYRYAKDYYKIVKEEG